jgi:hypothetical protein
MSATTTTPDMGETIDYYSKVGYSVGTVRDLDKDITSKMGFMPIVGPIKEMDKRIFNDGKMCSRGIFNKDCDL